MLCIPNEKWGFPTKHVKTYVLSRQAKSWSLDIFCSEMKLQAVRVVDYFVCPGIQSVVVILDLIRMQ